MFSPLFNPPPSIYLALVLALGMVAQWLAWRLMLPAIVLLLFFGFGFGFLVGPPESYLGQTDAGATVLFPMVSLAVGVILFEGGLNLRLREIRDTSGVVMRLVFIGVATTAVLATIAAHFLLGFTWQLAAILGALLSLSGPTVILPILRQVRPERRVGSVVLWEGIVNDPVGAVLAALVFEAVSEGYDMTGGALWGLGETIIIGFGLGISSAWIVCELIRRYWIPDFLQNPVVLAVVLLVFALSNYMQPESGLVTVTVAGIYLANQRQITIKHVIAFKENLRVLLLSVLFIVLASRIEIGPEQLQGLGWGALAFVAALIVVIRPLAVFAATLGSDLSWQERMFLAWIHPRGIVAAAVATLFALELAKSHPELAREAEQFVLVTFLVVVVTVTVYGTTLGPLARRLGLSRENPQGILFVGASPVVREIAKAVHNEGFVTLLVDTNPEHISAARLDGLRVCYASIGSEYVHQETDLGDLGRLLAMTPNDEVNTLATSEFAEQMGTANVYQLAPHEKESERHRRVPSHLKGRILFDRDLTEDELRHRFENGYRIKKSTITQGYTYDDFRQMYGESALVLFVVRDKKRLIVLAVDTEDEPKAGDKLISLIPPQEQGS